MNAQPWIAQYDAGVPASLEPYPQRTLLEFLDDAVAQRPGAPALLFKGAAMSWGQLAAASDAFASALAALGVRAKDRVALLLPNCPQFFIAELAAWKLGAIVAPMNPIYSAEELEVPMRTTGANVVVTLSAFYERVKQVQQRVGLQHVVVTNIKDHLPPLLRFVFTLALEKKGGHRVSPRDGDPTMKALLEAHAGRRPAVPRPTPDDDALLLMSGGTTGTPKAVRVHHGGLVRTGMQVRAWLARALPVWTGVYCMPLPMFHSYGAVGVQSVCIIGRNAIALVPNPRDLDDVVRTIERTKPAVFCGVPTLYNALLEHPRVAAGKVDFRSMEACVSGAAPLHLETHRRFTAVTGARVIEGYALTESVLAATLWPLDGKQKIGSVGIPLPDCSVRIVDADDPTKEVPVGEVGEILLTGPQVMRGYFNAPEGTDPMLSTHADGTTWLHTADLGRLDEDGFLFIVDRKKDLIKMGGMQVWPRDIEEVIARHPAVAEVGVRGFPDERRGEVAVAFVVRRAGKAVTGDEVRAWCKEHLPPFKVPARIAFKKELPKTLVGKVLRRLLVEDEAIVS